MTVSHIFQNWGKWGAVSASKAHQLAMIKQNILDLGSSAERRTGSNPVSRIN